MEAKKIIVTGGANRIGRSIALELASYDTQIVIHYSKSFVAAKKLKIELENLGSIVYLLKADLNNPGRGGLAKRPGWLCTGCN